MQDDESNPTDPDDGLVSTPPVPPPSPLDAAPTMADLYGWDELLADSNRKLVSLADLPHGCGLGESLNDLLGGGLQPGYMALVGARSAGAGKTAFLMQLADGLAARTAELVVSGGQEPLTPVVIVSEMTPRDLTVRSVARWTKTSSRSLRDKKSVGRALALRAAQAAFEGEFGRARRFQRYVEEPKTSLGLVGQIDGIVQAWCREPDLDGRDVWPVIVIDPIQRHAEGDNAVEALDVLSKAVRILKNDRGFIILLSSDTNTASARGQTKGVDPQQTAAAAIRGSYNLSHEADAGMVLGRREEPGKRKDGSEGPLIEVAVYKNRWGPVLPDPVATVVYDWEPAHLALAPWPVEDMEKERVAAEKERQRRWQEARVAKQQKVAKDSKGDNVDESEPNLGWVRE